MNDSWVSEFSTRELVQMHRDLHNKLSSYEFTAAVQRERALVTELSKRGVVSRYIDDLAKAAGTMPPESGAPAPSIEEVLMYAGGKPIGIDPHAVSVVRHVDNGDFQLKVASPALSSISNSILKAVQRQMPPGVEITLHDEYAGSDKYLLVNALYALQLVPAPRREAIVTTAKAYAEEFRLAASKASMVFKAGQDPRIPFRVAKQSAYEQIVTGAVLVPEVPDGTKTPESDADIYAEAEIYKAMVFWMENARAPFAYQHVDHGGKLLSNEDVVLLENWQARADFIEGDQHITKGTWMLSTRVRNPQLWEAIVKGEINSWSIGLECMASFEEAV